MSITERRIPPRKAVAMRQRWDDVTFLHWPVDAGIVQRRLPLGLTVDTFDGNAWVGLVPFHMVGIGLGERRPIPYLGTFPETNVRTYVRGPDGTAGVWFDSLDASRALPVAVARMAYRLPYHWAKMRIDKQGSIVRYESRRYSARPAPSKVTVDVKDRIASPGPLAEFLTDRWQLFVNSGAKLMRAFVDHPPWPLHRAEVVELAPGPLVEAGYPAPNQPPLVLYSPGVAVRVSKPIPVDD